MLLLLEPTDIELHSHLQRVQMLLQDNIIFNLQMLKKVKLRLLQMEWQLVQVLVHLKKYLILTTTSKLATIQFEISIFNLEALLIMMRRWLLLSLMVRLIYMVKEFTSVHHPLLLKTNHVQL